MSNKINKIRSENKDFFWSVVEPKCRRCGYNEYIPALNLHHLDPSQKNGMTDSLGRWLSLSRGVLLHKLSTVDFVILCSNCHAKLHGLLRSGRQIRMNKVVIVGIEEMIREYEDSKKNVLVDNYKKREAARIVKLGTWEERQRRKEESKMQRGRKPVPISLEEALRKFAECPDA